MIRRTLLYGLIAGAFVFFAVSVMAAAPLARQGSSPVMVEATPSP